MITVGRARIAQSAAELPCPSKIQNLYLDLETTSFDDDEKALDPWAGDRALGIAATWDDCPEAFYAPLRHEDGRWNIDRDQAMKWASDLLDNSKRWINHNIKFDAHFLRHDGVIPSPSLELIDTMTQSKMVDSDRMSHKLKPLCRDRLGMEMDEEVRLKAYLKSAKSKDYGIAPADMIGEYACMDVIGNRALSINLDASMHADLAKGWAIERQLTSVLLDMETVGMRIDATQCKIESLKSMREMVRAATRVSELIGRELTDSNQCIYGILIDYLGLPVLSWDEGKPSFNKDALKLYAGHPDVVFDERSAEVVACIRSYRTESHFNGLFAQALLEKRDSNDVVHPSYNQLVRTGRMSCSRPNAQQFSPRAKRLLIPREGCSFLVVDASQIEFRLIVHYLNDQEAIKAYAENPLTDFHQWVADLCGVARGPAKTLNFSMAYGAGRKNVTGQLVANKDIMASVGAAVDAEIASGAIDTKHRATRYAALCSERASKLYDLYHARLPVKLLAEKMASVCRGRGYIKTLYGTHRNLPNEHAHRAGNSAVQGSAGYLVKDRMNATAERNYDVVRNAGIHMLAQVHDELVFEGPTKEIEDVRIQDSIVSLLCKPDLSLRVPIMWTRGTSPKNWAEAKH